MPAGIQANWIIMLTLINLHGVLNQITDQGTHMLRPPQPFQSTLNLHHQCIQIAMMHRPSNAGIRRGPAWCPLPHYPQWSLWLLPRRSQVIAPVECCSSIQDCTTCLPFATCLPLSTASWASSRPLPPQQQLPPLAMTPARYPHVLQTAQTENNEQ